MRVYKLCSLWAMNTTDHLPTQYQCLAELPGMSTIGMLYVVIRLLFPKKRLALARCMVRQPAVLPLDEPFASLDVDAKFNLYGLVQELWLNSKCSVILVTHDIHDAILLADRVIVSAPRPFKTRAVLRVPVGGHVAKKSPPLLPTNIRGNT